MAAFAPPVQHDKFFYSSLLYADAGNDNHHPRASVAELAALLRPEAPKRKKSKTPTISMPATDHPWHFWTSQLIHYGLASTKDKNSAKIRLLNALIENRLEVPRWITKLEAEMKKKWEAENKKLKKAAKESGVPQFPASRQAETTPRSSRVKVSVKIELSDGAPAKGPATAPATPKNTATKRKRDHSELSTPAKKPKPRVKKEEAVEAKSSDFGEHLPVPRAEPEPGDVVISGTYDIGIDYVEYPAFTYPTDGLFEFVVLTEEATGTCWAKFQWAMLDGIIKMDPGPTYETITHFHTLGWRIRNVETGRLTFGRNCTGKMRFDASTRMLEGVLYDVPGAGRINFHGDRMSGPRRAGGLSREWNCFVEEAYGSGRY
ncbi:hypothetical protein E8E12_007779 [Didymella heteroderae]|uniref:Uncharacterized protein n=1 Tax=Didymella heteroderae TaxID=1769908 RepID=A0A9P5BZT7_9PLEO|nr:hypothetical protein E8E12_007779 [Didymella heteroderae]